MEFHQRNINNPIFGHRKVTIEELIQDPHSNTTYIRQFTEESYASGGQYLYVNQINVVDKINLEKSILPILNKSGCDNTMTNYNNFIKRGCDNLIEETPMEVDLNRSNERLINKIREIEEFQLRKRRDEALTNVGNIQTSSRLVPIKKPSINGLSKVLLIIISVLVLIGIYVVTAGERFIYVDKKLQIENLKNDLKETLHHQDEALNVIIKNIERMESWNEGIKVLPLIGTTGVGKTFTVNIIKKHFFPELVHEVTNLNDQQKIIDNLHSCCCNLIIVDNLKASDLDIFVGFIEKLPKSHDILVLPIFNVHDTTDGVTFYINEGDFKSIREKFDKSDFYYDLVVYDVLDHLVIEKWLRKQLYKKKIDERRHDILVESILNHDSVKYKGFKGLNLKLLLSLKE